MKTISRKKPKYWANACNYPCGEDLESSVFDRKSEAIAWAKKFLYCWVRLAATREVVLQKHEGLIISQ